MSSETVVKDDLHKIFEKFKFPAIDSFSSNYMINKSLQHSEVFAGSPGQLSRRTCVSKITNKNSSKIKQNDLKRRISWRYAKYFIIMYLAAVFY